MKISAERRLAAAPAVVFAAWTEQFGRWFTTPDRVLMTPRVDEPFFFEVEHEGERHPHYGRFLTLEPNCRIEMTWMNAGGTAGAETVVRIELQPDGPGTLLRLSHEGFPTPELAARHAEAWPRVLENLDRSYPAP